MKAPQDTPDEEALDLLKDFPPVTTSAWEAAIERDLKGADYEEKLVWRTEEGVAVRPYYRRDDAQITHAVSDYLAGNGWEENQDFIVPEDAIRADYLHDAGGTATQELAFALAQAVEKPVPRMVFVYAAGSNYFFEIAKLRAARLLWATAMAAFDSEELMSAPARIHVRTARANKSFLDPYTNLLRVTTEAMSAVMGGCDSLTVEAFGFDPHLAANVQRILREEAHLGQVADPAGGSYYIEALTDALAREAWKLFQHVEAEGGWSKALQSGMVDEALSSSRAAKAEAIASRRRILVGVNSYPDSQERLPPFQQGGFRLAEPFEAIRERTARHAARTGHRPRILLLKRGDVRMANARASFCWNFFGCAGFNIAEPAEFDGTAADLIVLCSSDAEYPALANEVCPHVSAPVLVAGYPKEQVERLLAAGVQGFVHTRSNAVETLTEWQNRFGMEALTWRR